MEKILAFVDLLGFSQMVNADENKARVILNDFYNISFSEIKSVLTPYFLDSFIKRV